MKNGEELKVDGNFVIVRIFGVNFFVIKLDKFLIGFVLNGEGFLNIFIGNGIVWLVLI